MLKFLLSDKFKIPEKFGTVKIRKGCSDRVPGNIMRYLEFIAAFKQIGPEGFSGDAQADRRVHGGPEKAVHLYPAAHYTRLAERFPEAAAQLQPGSLGENISSSTLDETRVRIGDIFRLGEARLQVCQPRSPCWKIDDRFGCAGMAAYIAEQRLTGWYFRVLQPG